jgi:hypothetical protein
VALVGAVEAGQAEDMSIRIPSECRTVIANQCGVLGRQQALALGMPSDSIETLLRTGRWRRLDRGVYATFTGPPGRAALYWSVLVRAGPNAMFSHQTAADLYGFADPFGRQRQLIHVTVPRNHRLSKLPGVIVHRVVRAAEWRHPSLSPPRTRVEATILDLVDAAPSPAEAFGWIYRAAGKGLTDAGRLRREVATRPALRWRAVVVAALADVEEGVRSNLEYRYVRDVERAHGLPRARRQVRVERGGRVCYLDNLYQASWVGVELDGLVAHPPGERWRDFRRDNAGVADGIVTLRYGWADVTGRPCEVAAQVAAVLRRRGWAGPVLACGPGCAAAAAPASAGARTSLV